LLVPPLADERILFEKFYDVRLVKLRIRAAKDQTRSVRVLETSQQHAASSAAALRSATCTTETDARRDFVIPQLPERALLRLKTDFDNLFRQDIPPEF